MQRQRVAIHLHTDYSFDSNFSPEQVVEAALREGIECLAITDHDEIDGALHARDLGQVRVIVGSEVSTADGHLIGLFLKQRVRPGLSAYETALAIKEQGGLVLAPHPFATLCDDSLLEATVELTDLLDAVEIFNAQNPLGWEDRRAARFARDCELPTYVGCDTHIRGPLAPAWQEMPSFDGPEDFLVALRSSAAHCRRFGVRYLGTMAYRHFRDKFGMPPTPGFGTNYWRMRNGRERGSEGAGEQGLASASSTGV